MYGYSCVQKLEKWLGEYICPNESSWAKAKGCCESTTNWTDIANNWQEKNIVNGGGEDGADRRVTGR
jgi:hypothetical protein